MYTEIYHRLLIYKCCDLERKCPFVLYKWLIYSPTTESKIGVNIYILGEIKTRLIGGLPRMVILFDRFNLPEDIFEIIFSTGQQTVVARELIKFMADHTGEISKTEMSLFATQLHDGVYETTLEDGQYKGKKVKLSYNKRQFYDRILTPMKAMGLIDYDLYKKTYKISIKFSNDLMKVGLQWKTELRKYGINL